MELSTDYLKQGRSSSETFEGAQHVKQITSQGKTLRFKRSDDNPELPENFKVGQAIGGGDSFFDSVAKGLKQLKPEKDFSVKSLREVCKSFAQRQVENDQSWIKGALRNEAEAISVYVRRIEFTSNDIEQKSGSVNVLELTSPIWGRSQIEGRIICKEYNVDLHVVEKHVVEGKKIWLDQIVNSEGSRSMDSIDYNEENTIHIINRGNAHFEPILSTQEVQYNKHSDYDDETTPEGEVINTIKSGYLEEEKLAKIKRVFEKEPKPDIDFQAEDNDTLLHIAERTITNSKKDKSEDSSRKRPRISLQTAEEYRGKKRTQNEENSGQVKKLKTSEGYPASGLKSSLHGTVYQLKLLMLFLKRGLDQEYSFSLATEMDAAEKFDDVVFQYTEGGEEVCRFLQAKHKQDDNKKITVNDLLTEQDGEFSLQKYFISYRKIKQNPVFKGYKLKEFVICTNIDLEESLMNSFEQVEGEDNILRVNGEKSERLKLKVDKFPNKKDLVSRLSNTSELNRLAKRLAKCVLKNKPLDLKDELFRSYCGVLREKVIDVKNVEQREEKGNKRKEIKKSYAKFHSNFLDGSSQELENFRSAFLKAYQEMSKEQMNVNEFWQKMKAMELPISQTFGKVFELDINPQLTNSEVFAKAIANAMSVAKQSVVNIKREKGTGIIRDNINKLAGHVLIKKGDKEIGTYYFSSAFFDDDNKLPGNLENFKSELKAELKSKNIEFDRNKYKFCIANFETCEEEQLDSKLLLPDDYISKGEIDDFLDKLVFAVNQPNEVELGNIIEAEMGEDKDINLIDSELIASKFQKDMLDWMKEKKGRFISCEDGKKFFKEAKQKLFKLMLIGLTLEYRVKIKDFSIDFSEKPSGLSKFLVSHEKQIFNLVNPHNTILNSIKVCQTLKDFLEYRRDDSYIFTRLSSLLHIQNLVIQAFQSETSNNLIVIECKSTEKNVGQLYSQLSKVMEFNSNKKVILITQEQDSLSAKFKKFYSDKYIESKDERNSLTDLTVESQEKLREKGKVIFQGKEVNLGTLVDDGLKHLVDGEMLSKLINNEEIKIGKALTDSKYDDVKYYYIDRTLNRQVKIKKGVTKNFMFFVTNNCQINGIRKDQDIVLISDTSENFKDLCNQYKEYNIHWLKKEEKDLIWQQSYGDLYKLREFIRKDALLEYKPEGITDIKDRVVIISAEPGMGKSTILNSLALKTKDFLWIIRINLLDYSTELKREAEKKTKLNKAEVIKFLYRIVGFQLFQEKKEETTEKKEKREQTIEKVLSGITVKNSEIVLDGKVLQGFDLLEIELFNNFYNQGKIVLLFDGFDEISPDYTAKVFELLQVLKKSKVVKLWITTRPYNSVQEELEDGLSVFSYSLKQLLPEEQKSFLMKFWKAKLKLRELDEQRSGVFIDELLDRLPGSIGDKDFMSIPLHAFMVAEMFKDGFKSFYDSNEKDLSDKYKTKIEGLDLVALYEKFIDIKFYKIRFGEKKPGMNIDDPDIKGLIKNKHRELIADHMKLALYEIFNKKEVEKLLSQEEIREVTKLIEKIKQAKEKAGIIDRIINDKPRFVHLTFAEYFVASYFWKCFKSVQFDKFEDFVNNIIIQNLIMDDRIQICKFLQLKPKKDLESNINFPDKQKKLRTLLTKLLHYIKQYDYNNNGKQSTKLLLGIVEFSFSTKEKVNVAVIKNNEKLKLLCISAEMGYIKLANILETKLNKNFLQKYLKFDKWQYSPLWLAAQTAHLNILEILVEKFSYDSNWKDKDSKTLVQRIFEQREFDVLRSCLKLDIADCKPYEDLNRRERLPIVAALEAVAPSDVIKLLIEKTNSNLVNSFPYFKDLSGATNIDHRDIFSTQYILLQLLKYDKEITELAIEKGIDFSQAIGLLLFEYGSNSLSYPPGKLTYAYFSRICFHSDKEFLKVFETIELLLKAGVGYNYKENQISKTILQLVEIAYYMHKLLYEVHKFHTQKMDKSSNPLDTILKLIIDNVSSSHGFRGYKLVALYQEAIYLSHDYKYKSSKQIEQINFPISTLYFKFYKDNVNLVRVLVKLRDFITNAKEEIEAFKRNPDSKIYNDIFIGFEDMLENKQKMDKLGYKSLALPVKELLERVLKLYIRQDYEINDALKEVEEEVLRWKKIKTKLNYNLKTGELLDILAIKNIDTNEELQDLISKIYECRATECLRVTLEQLNHIGQQRIMGVLEEMFKFGDQSTKIFELFKKLDSGYKKLTKAIENKNYQEIDNILQNVESDFIKAVINGQDDEYGSPLYYAAFKGDVHVTKILLDSGANPNLQMQEGGMLLRTADETQKDEDWEHDYQCCTPLHVAVFKGQLEVAKILVNCGADVNAMSTYYQATALHMAVDSGKLDVVNFLVEKGAHVNAKEHRGRTPLHTAAQGGYNEILQLLLSKQADPNIQDIFGETPLDLAQKKLNQDPESYKFKMIKASLLSVADESQHQEG